MAFPETRLTLIQRLSAGGSDQDWKEFLNDYWGPVCGFAMRWGSLSFADAEDVASETFQAILQSELLARWQRNRAARLRTLLCSVARNVISNRNRVAEGRRRIWEELVATDWAPSGESQEQVDIFYAAWVDDLLRTVVDRLMTEFHREGKGDYFRVLFGRVCEGLSTAEIAQMLQIKVTDVENYFKAAKKRLGAGLESTVRSHVQKYCGESEIEDEFRTEWSQLCDYLSRHGGLELAVRRSHESSDISGLTRKSQAFRRTQSLVAGKSSAKRSDTGEK